MTWQIDRDGYTAEFVQGKPSRPHKPYVRVTGPGIKLGEPVEFALPEGGCMDGLDFMHKCITNVMASNGNCGVKDALQYGIAAWENRR